MAACFRTLEKTITAGKITKGWGEKPDSHVW